MALNLAQPKDLDTNLLALVEAGDWRVHVLDYKRWERLPSRLQAKYYPLTRHHTGGYRMYPKFMMAREDLSRRVSSRTQLDKKAVVLPPQRVKTKTMMQKPIVATDPSTKDTDLESKTFAQVSREARALAKRPATVTTRYSRF